MIRISRRIVLILAALPAVPGPAVAQGSERAVPPVPVPSAHWVYPLLDRMAADGLLDGVWMPGRRPAGADAIVAALDSAADRAARVGPAWRETAVVAGEWIREEYGTPGAGGPRVRPTAGARWGDGPRTDRTAGLAGVELLYGTGDGFAVWARPEAAAGAGGIALRVPRMGAAWRRGPFRLAGAYDAQRLGPGASGGIVLHDAAELPWLEASLGEPVILPGVLRHAGPFQMTLTASGIGADTLGPGVAFLAGELRFQPHPRVTLGLYRTAAIAGEVDGQSPGVWDIMVSLAGGHTTPNFEDSKASFSGSVRADVLGVTVTPYFVWGFEDSAGIDEDPAAILGVWVPAVPIAGVPVGFRYEYTGIGEAGQVIWPWSAPWQWRNWYRHSTGRGVYVDGDERLLGHPLGGYGHEHRLELEAPLPASGLLIRAEAFTRERERGVYEHPNHPGAIQTYRNLLHDELPGRSRGGSLELAWSGARLRLDGGVRVEAGAAGWTRYEATVEARFLLQRGAPGVDAASPRE